MAFLLLAVFGYLQLAEADGRSLQRIVSTGMVLWWEFTSCSENCCYYHWAAADLPGITKGLQKARTHTEVCRRLLRSAGHNISRKLNKGQERDTEKLKGEKKSKNTSLLCELTWRARMLGKRSDLEQQWSAFVFLPHFTLFEWSFLFIEPSLYLYKCFSAAFRLYSRHSVVLCTTEMCLSGD